METLEEIKNQAVAESWSRKQIKAAAYESGLSKEQRDEVWAACGHTTMVQAAMAKADEEAAAKAETERRAADAARETEARREAEAKVEAERKATEQAEAEARKAAKAAIADGSVIFCDAAENKVTRVVNSYGRKATFDNGGCRVGLLVETPVGDYVARHYNSKCYHDKSGEYDQFAAECYAVLKAAELAVECGLKKCTISNDRIGGFEASTKRGYIGAKYLWVASKIARESGVEVEFELCSSEENKADRVSRSEE